MIWPIVGWGIIGLGFVLLILFTLLFKEGDEKTYPVRTFPEIESLKANRIAAIEGGYPRNLVLGYQFNSRAYPGLGLNALVAVPGFLDPETLADGRLSISASNGTLVVFARQIVKNRYQNGISLALAQESIQPIVLGPTPFSYSAGLLVKLNKYPQQGLIMMGDFGAESSLWSEINISKRGAVFACAGTMTSQASLYPHTENLLMGEESYFLPGLIDPNPGRTAGWLTADILRIILILIILTGVILKMMGVL